MINCSTRACDDCEMRKVAYFSAPYTLLSHLSHHHPTFRLAGNCQRGGNNVYIVYDNKRLALAFSTWGEISFSAVANKYYLVDDVVIIVDFINHGFAVCLLIFDGQLIVRNYRYKSSIRSGRAGEGNALIVLPPPPPSQMKLH